MEACICTRPNIVPAIEFHLKQKNNCFESYFTNSHKGIQALQKWWQDKISIALIWEAILTCTRIAPPVRDAMFFVKIQFTAFKAELFCATKTMHKLKEYPNHYNDTFVCTKLSAKLMTWIVECNLLMHKCKCKIFTEKNCFYLLVKPIKLSIFSHTDDLGNNNN